MLRLGIVILVNFILGIAIDTNFGGTYKGTFEGAEVTLELKQEGTKVTGKATFAEVKLDITGDVKGTTLEGILSFLGEKLHLRASLDGDKLLMKIAEEDDNGKPNWTEADTVTFIRTKGDSDADSNSVSRVFSKEPLEVLKNGVEYVHPSGGKFRYPKGWSIKEVEGGLQLIPQDAAPNETILILADSAEGKTDAADPEVLAFLDEQVSAILPTMKREKAIERANAGNGKGVIATWNGKVDGKEMRLKAYVTILKNNGIALIIAAPPEQVELRDKTLRSIFFSLGWGQGKLDTSLVGTWKYYSYSTVSSRETSATAVLRADGTFSYSSSSEANNSFSGKDSGGNELWTGWVSSRSGSGYDGRWIADGRTLTLNFEDGTSDSFEYELVQQGSAIVIKLYTGDSKPMEWAKQ